MCYDISYLTKRQIDYAGKYGSSEDVEDIRRRLPKVWHTNGFSHAEVPVVTSDRPGRMQLFEWGLVPRWTTSLKDALSFRQKTLNARGETLFEKTSFRHAALNNRCLVVVDGFFEHHHIKGKAFPYFIQRKDKRPFAMGGLWEAWEDKEDGVVHYTFSIVTTAANARMAQIHNNPRAIKRSGPRMPLIISQENESLWTANNASKEDIESLLQPFPEDELTDHPVLPLRGGASPGNAPEAVKKYDYPELGQLGLF